MKTISLIALILLVSACGNGTNQPMTSAPAPDTTSPYVDSPMVDISDLTDDQECKCEGED